jgi:hypothetical protein
MDSRLQRFYPDSILAFFLNENDDHFPDSSSRFYLFSSATSACQILLRSEYWWKIMRFQYFIHFIHIPKFGPLIRHIDHLTNILRLLSEFWAFKNVIPEPPLPFYTKNGWDCKTLKSWSFGHGIYCITYSKCML